MAEETKETSNSPVAPPVPCLILSKNHSYKKLSTCSCHMSTESTRDLWARLFSEGYRADVIVHTSEGTIPSHASILGMTSPVMKGMLKSSKKKGQKHNKKNIYIKGVPHDAILVFLRFLYTSCCEQEEMNEFILHLFVLSHVFAVPVLKKLCEEELEKGLLTHENVVDILQLSKLCDAPRLDLLCQRMILKDFKTISRTEGWNVLKKTNPKVEKEIKALVHNSFTKKKERLKRLEEQKIYIQLHEAMEALVHICRDGCHTIGPHNKVLIKDGAPCQFPACKGLEALVRHFASCKKRVAGGCTHCKRMWQLLELHSRICVENENDFCKVPLCSHFKGKIEKESKKDEMKWKLLVSKVLEAKRSSPSPVIKNLWPVAKIMN